MWARSDLAGTIARPLSAGSRPAAVSASDPEAEVEPSFALTVLPRHGRRPLGFQGRLLVAAALDEPGLPVVSRIALYEMPDGSLAAAIRHTTRAPLGEATRSYAEAAPVEALLRFLHAHDPLRDLPADWMLQATSDVTEAMALGPRLRSAWRGLIAACFGQPEDAEAHHTCKETENERDERLRADRTA